MPDRGYKRIHIDVVLNKDGEQFVDLVSLVTAYVVVGVVVRGHLVPHTAKELLEGGGQQVLENLPSLRRDYFDSRQTWLEGFQGFSWNSIGNNS